MKKEIFEDAQCKINLFLELGDRLPNGLHNMDMVMQSLSLCDSIKIKKTTSGGITIKNGEFLPPAEDTIIFKCADSFFEFFGIKDRSVEIELQSNIPFMSGLGGGSADGAAVLRGLAKLYGIGENFPQLSEIGSKIGADIPFCLRGGLCQVGGFGEKILPISLEKPLSFGAVLVKPRDFSICTKDAFNEIDKKGFREKKSSKEILSAIKRGELKEVASLCYNGFFESGREKYSPCKKVLEGLLSFGSLGGAMTGSGSAVFGIFETKKDAENAAAQLKKERALPLSDIFVAETTGESMK